VEVFTSEKATKRTKRMFKNIRLSYLDDLENDPEVVGLVEDMNQASEIDERFVFNLTKKEGIDQYWDEAVVGRLSALSIEDEGESLVNNDAPAGPWGRFKGDQTRMHLDLIGEWTMLSPEDESGVIWDTKTRTILFCSDEILSAMSDPQIRGKALAFLAEKLDNRSDGHLTI